LIAMTFETSPDRRVYYPEPERRQLVEQCLDELEEECGTSMDLSDRLGVHWKVVAATLSKLFKRGRVDRLKSEERGYVYFLPGRAPRQQSCELSGQKAAPVYARQFKW